MAITIQPKEIRIDNEAIAFKPNSYMEVLGAGSVETKSQSIGGGGSEPVHMLDKETEIGQMKFAMRNTPENQLILEKILRERLVGRKIEAIFDDGSIKILTNAVQQGDIENAKQKDGGFEFDFKGARMI